MAYDKRKSDLKEDIRKDSEDNTIIHESFKFEYTNNNSYYEKPKTSAGYTALQASQTGGKTNRPTKKTEK